MASQVPVNYTATKYALHSWVIFSILFENDVKKKFKNVTVEIVRQWWKNIYGNKT